METRKHTRILQLKTERAQQKKPWHIDWWRCSSQFEFQWPAWPMHLVWNGSIKWQNILQCDICLVECSIGIKFSVYILHPHAFSAFSKIFCFTHLLDHKFSYRELEIEEKIGSYEISSHFLSPTCMEASHSGAVCFKFPSLLAWQQSFPASQQVSFNTR